MRPLALRIHGTLRELLVGERENPSRILLLNAIKPDRSIDPTPPFETLFVRFGFVIQGIERPFMPAFVMDDWGNEVKKLSIFDWLFKDGDQYPRSEVFGYEETFEGPWFETQRFVREFELGARYPTFAVSDRAGFPLPEDVVKGIVVIDPAVETVERIKVPVDWPMPLKRTKAPVWRGSLPSIESLSENLSALPLKR